MAKNKISEWSSTAANNTDIGGIDIAEGCAPSGINNAIRELMAQVKDQQAGTDGDNLTVGGNLTVNSNLIVTGTTTLTGLLSGVNLSTSGTTTIGDASGDSLVINSSAISVPNGANFDSNTLVIDATNNRVGVLKASPAYPLDVTGITASTSFLGDLNGIVGVTVTAGSFVIGKSYTIVSLGTTNFTLVGADATPAVGETFVATGVGTGTGTARAVNSGYFTTINSTGNITIEGTLTSTGAISGSLNGSVGATTANAGYFTSIKSTPAAINASDMVTGMQYTITSLGTSVNWNAMGADITPAVGEVFVKNSTAYTGTGGTATPSALYTTGLVSAGTVTALINATSASTVDSLTIGYRELPQVAKSTTYTLALTDNGKHIYYTGAAATLTIPTNASIAFPIGTAVTIINNGTGSLTLGTTSLTVYYAGTTLTGNRTLATKGMATIVKVATDTWFISGAGLS